MATTTTNFGWDIPQSTDLVKDGATAIAALGQDIDTAFVDFKGGTTGQVLKKTSGTDLDVEWGTASSGLTLINTTSFSGVASQAIDGVFSATYQNYRAVLTISNSTSNNNLIFRWRTGSPAADVTATNYERSGITQYASSGSVTARGSTGQGLFYFAGTISAAPDRGGGIFEMQKPFDSAASIVTYLGSNQDGGGLGHWSLSTIYTASTSMNGFVISADSGNISGTVSVYGYNK
jgi:hypothetical protein